MAERFAIRQLFRRASVTDTGSPDKCGPHYRHGTGGNRDSSELGVTSRSVV
jgi:hypothetical protein